MLTALPFLHSLIHLFTQQLGMQCVVYPVLEAGEFGAETDATPCI